MSDVKTARMIRDAGTVSAMVARCTWTADPAPQKRVVQMTPRPTAAMLRFLKAFTEFSMARARGPERPTASRDARVVLPSYLQRLLPKRKIHPIDRLRQPRAHDRLLPLRLDEIDLAHDAVDAAHARWLLADGELRRFNKYVTALILQSCNAMGAVE